MKLRCTAEDVRQLEHVHEFAYLRMGQTPTSDPDWDVGIEDVLALPYYESPEIIGLRRRGGRFERAVRPRPEGRRGGQALERGHRG